MEIKGNKAYLTIHEQQQSGLSSPIDVIAEEGLLAGLEDAKNHIHHCQNVLDADPEDMLASKRAEAVSLLGPAIARHSIYMGIISYKLIEGLLDQTESEQALNLLR